MADLRIELEGSPAGKIQSHVPNLPPSCDVKQQEMMRMIYEDMNKRDIKMREETAKLMQEQEQRHKHEMSAMERRQEENEKEFDKIKIELEAYKNFENMYQQIGGETIFYMDLESLRELMLEAIGDDQEKITKFEEWYELKKKQHCKRVGLLFLAGSVGGGVIGGVACAIHVPILLTAAGVACASSCGILIAAVAGGVILVGVGLGIYKLYRMYRVKKIEKARETIIPEDLLMGLRNAAIDGVRNEALQP